MRSSSSSLDMGLATVLLCIVVILLNNITVFVAGQGYDFRRPYSQQTPFNSQPQGFSGGSRFHPAATTSPSFNFNPAISHNGSPRSPFFNSQPPANPGGSSFLPVAVESPSLTSFHFDPVSAHNGSPRSPFHNSQPSGSPGGSSFHSAAVRSPSSTSLQVDPVGSHADSSSFDERATEPSPSRPKNHCTPTSRTRSRFLSRYRSKEPTDPLCGFRIVCLFNNKNYYKSNFTPSMIDPCLCTHVNYEFAILDPKTYELITGEPDLDIQNNFYQEAVDLKKYNPELKVLLTLGGWEDSTKKYSEMADDAEKRSNFVEKVVTFLKAHEFDGLDLAWEYPNCWQGAIGAAPKDKSNFATLLKELREAFDAKGLLLSVSVGAIKREIDVAYDVKAVSDAVDYINVMTYDMHGPWESTLSHHTQFDKLPGDADPFCNVKAALQVWIDNGANKTKLNMGMACYAKTFKITNPSNCKIGASASGIGNAGPVSQKGGFLFYHEICQFLNSGDWVEEEDKSAGFYAHSGDQWACYDPPVSVVKKTRYVVDEGLGGIMLKDMSGDDFQGLCFNMPFCLTKMARFEIMQSCKKHQLQLHG